MHIEWVMVLIGQSTIILKLPAIDQDLLVLSISAMLKMKWERIGPESSEKPLEKLHVQLSLFMLEI